MVTVTLRNDQFVINLRHLCEILQTPHLKCFVQSSYKVPDFASTSKMFIELSRMFMNLCFDSKFKDSEIGEGKSVRVTVAYSDTFPVAGGCHSNRLGLY